MDCFEFCQFGSYFSSDFPPTAPPNTVFSPRIPNDDADVNDPKLIQQIKEKSQIVSSKDQKLGPNLTCVTSFTSLLNKNEEYFLNFNHLQRPDLDIYKSWYDYILCSFNIDQFSYHMSVALKSLDQDNDNLASTSQIYGYYKFYRFLFLYEDIHGRFFTEGGDWLSQISVCSTITSATKNVKTVKVKNWRTGKLIALITWPCRPKINKPKSKTSSKVGVAQDIESNINTESDSNKIKIEVYENAEKDVKRQFLSDDLSQILIKINQASDDENFYSIQFNDNQVTYNHKTKKIKFSENLTVEEKLCVFLAVGLFVIDSKEPKFRCTCLPEKVVAFLTDVRKMCMLIWCILLLFMMKDSDFLTLNPY